MIRFEMKIISFGVINIYVWYENKWVWDENNQAWDENNQVGLV